MGDHFVAKRAHERRDHRESVLSLVRDQDAEVLCCFGLDQATPSAPFRTGWMTGIGSIRSLYAFTA